MAGSGSTPRNRRSDGEPEMPADLRDLLEQMETALTGSEKERVELLIDKRTKENEDKVLGALLLSQVRSTARANALTRTLGDVLAAHDKCHQDQDERRLELQGKIHDLEANNQNLNDEVDDLRLKVLAGHDWVERIVEEAVNHLRAGGRLNSAKLRLAQQRIFDPEYLGGLYDVPAPKAASKSRAKRPRRG